MRLRRPAGLAWLLPLAGGWALSCGGPSARSGDGPGPQRVEPDEISVTIRNNCPESVELHVGHDAPAPGAAGERMSGSGILQRKVGKREQVWLRWRGEWSRRRATRPEQDGWVVEVLGSCDGIAGRSGPL